jgi:hypothetical protein
VKDAKRGLRGLLTWCVVAGVMLLGLWWAWPRPQAVIQGQAPLPSASLSAAASAPAAGQVANPKEGRASAPTATAADAETDIARDLRAWWASSEKVWDLCGVGRLPIPPALVALGVEAMLALPRHLGEDPQNAARKSLLNVMEHGSPRSQAAAALWRNQSAMLEGLRLATSAASAASPNAWAPPTTSAQTLQVVAKLAGAAETDAVLAAWLVNLCGTDPACRADAKARWLRADPDNGLARAEALGPTSSPESQAKARTTLSQAKHFQMQHGALAATVLASMPAEVPLYIQHMLLIEAVIVEGAYLIPPLAPFVDLCKTPTDAAARAECDAIARLMVERSDTLLVHRIGLKVGELSGWPKDEVAARRAETDSRHLGPEMNWLLTPNSCDAVKATKTWILELAEKGELAVLRERAKVAKQDAEQSKEAAPGVRR